MVGSDMEAVQQPVTERSYTARQAADHTLTDYDLVDYYAKTRLVVPSIDEGKGRGAQRRYSFNDLVAIMFVRVTRVIDVGFDSLRPAVALIQRTPDLGKRDLLIIDHEKHAYFAEYVIEEGKVVGIWPLAEDGTRLAQRELPPLSVQTGVGGIVSQLRYTIECHDAGIRPVTHEPVR